MIYIVLILVSYLLGRGALRALYGSAMKQDFGITDNLLTGVMVILGLAAAANLGAVVLGRSFSDCVFLFLAGLIILLVGAAILILTGKNREMRKPAGRSAEPKEIMVFAVFGVLVLLQVLVMVTGKRLYLSGDMTVEMVNGILTTETVGQINPLTGRAYELGVPLRLQILCLPMLYAIICDLFGLSAMELVWGVIPVLVLLASYGAFYSVAKALFPASRMKRGCFMVLVALLLWVGDYLYGMDGFGIMYAGYRGVTIRGTILLPYTFGLLLRKKWRLTLLCILAEACIVWTLYGMGACLFVTVGMIVTNKIMSKVARNAGGEDDL